MRNWLNTSITRTISSLSFILLSFLFVVIIYSVFKLQQIGQEMQEVAEIDVPLTEVTADMEVLQLRQHLLMEYVRQQGERFFADEQAKSATIEGFKHYDTQLSVLLDKVMGSVQNGLKFGHIRIRITDHQKAIKLVRDLHVQRTQFDNLAQRFFASGSQAFEAYWPALEQQAKQLDEQSNELLANIDQLTVKVSVHAEKQAKEFLLVNTILGLSALFIGIYLTFYIIQSFRRRMASVRGQIEFLHHSIHSDTGHGVFHSQRERDEFAELEKDLNTLMGQFSREMHDRTQVERQLLELATRDKLTGAFNRHKWDEQISEALMLAERGNPFSLILLDVDYFKKINDSQGHDMGDRVLQLLVARLGQHMRSSDLLFRLGGEEFAILARGSQREEACNIAEQLRLMVAELDEPGMPRMTVSLGVTSYQPGDDQDSLVKRADRLLYEAKGAGRNRVMVG